MRLFCKTGLNRMIDTVIRYNTDRRVLDLITRQ